MSVERLTELITQAIPAKLKSDDPEERVKEALEKALDNTTPERAGCPWDEKKERHE